MLRAIEKEFNILAHSIISMLKFVYEADMEIIDCQSNVISSASPKAPSYKCADDIYKAVFKSKQAYIAQSPRKDAICFNCAERNRCLKKMAAVFPIRANGIVYGALGIFCASLTQKDNITLGLTGDNPFILNALNLMEKNLENRQYSMLMENTASAFELMLSDMNGCFIDLDEAMNIINYGGKLESVLNGTPYGTVKITKLSDHVYRLEISDKEFLVRGSLSPTNYGNIFIFNIASEAGEDNDTDILRRKTRPPIILGQSKETVKLRSIAEKSSKTNSIVLISGKRGSGKENTARFIHRKKEKPMGQFIKLNCSDKNKDEMLLALYGDVSRNKAGKIKSAENGVLYIENVDYMPKDMLTELIMSAKSSYVYYPGGIKQRVDFKLVLSTSNELILDEILSACGEGVNIIPLHVPNLANVSESIPEYFRYFTNMYQYEYSIDSVTTDDDIINLLCDYSWPGNMKELQLVSLRITEFTARSGYIDSDVVRSILSSSFKAFQPDAGRTLKEIEDVHIKMAVMSYGESVPAKQAAADELGIGIATLYRKTGHKNKF